MNKSKKSDTNKTAVQTAENKPTVKETPAAVVKTETKTTSVTKNTAKKAAPKTESAAKKTTAKASAKKSEAKTVKTAKTAAKSTSKTDTKPTAKKTTKTSAAKTPAKKGGRKPAPVTIDTICTKMNKKIDKRKASAIKEKIAVEIEVWGFEDGSNAYMYIEVNDGAVTVAPYNYKEYSFRVSISFANTVAFVDGKTDLNKLVGSGDFYAEGNIASAVKLAAVF